MEYKVSIKGIGGSSLELIKFMKENVYIAREMPVGQLYELCKQINSTNGWSPNWEYLSTEFRKSLENGTFTSNIVKVNVTEENDFFDSVNDTGEIQRNLLERASNGDVEAAFEYCRRELAGMNVHGDIG